MKSINNINPEENNKIMDDINIIQKELFLED